MLRLVVRYNGHMRTFPMPREEVRLGSAQDNDLVIAYLGVSRHHALLKPRGRGFVVKDLGSKNGLIWQGNRLPEVRLAVGQEVQMGSATLHLEEVSTSDAEVALRLDGSSSLLSTVAVAGEPGGPMSESSPAAALRVVKELESTPSFDLGQHHEIVASARRALGASTLVTFRVTEGGDPAFVGCNGRLPAGDEIHELTVAAAKASQTRLLATEISVGGEPCLLAVSPKADPRFLAALFPRESRLTEWRRDFFTYLVKAILAPQAEPTSIQRTARTPKLRFPTDVVLGSSLALGKLLEEMSQTVVSDLDVLLLGETGTGKEVFARMIHDSGPSSMGPFVAVNCAAIPAELLEAELFGVAARVATGVDPRPGHFLQAEGGTLFLDEVAELTDSLQAKLLRVLQEREVLPLGAPKAKPISVRVVSASNRDIEALMEKGDFRADLYYRLAQLSFTLPPLRDRREDIPQLVFHFAGRATRQYGKRIRGVSRKALDRLAGHSWPGNVRELENLVTRAVLVCPEGGTIESDHLGNRLSVGEESASAGSGAALLQERVDALERKAILEALRETRGNKTQAAKRLGLTRNGLDSKMKRLGLTASDLD